MAALIIGGDRVASYKDWLVERGYFPVRHWNGRKKSECHRQIPLDTRLVIVLVDQVNHGLVRKMRRAADQMAVPVVFSRRCVSQLGAAVATLAAR